MLLSSIVDFSYLLFLALCGWLILAKLRMPAAEVLGPVFLIGTMRALQIDLPYSPPLIFQAAQIVIGIYVGSMLNRETVRQLKPMAAAALVIVAWAIGIIFIIGFFIARFTALDLYTAMLSASMGGLPEISIIALASGASIAIVIGAQMLRLLGTIFIFPLILVRLEQPKNRPGEAAGDSGIKENSTAETTGKESGTISSVVFSWKKRLGSIINGGTVGEVVNSYKSSWLRIIMTLILATSGGVLLNHFDVPAGLLVGSILFVSAASLLGVKTSRISPRLFDLLLVVIGITIADNISYETISIFGNWHVMAPILIATLFIFATSLLISQAICRITGWDYPTCFLAAAPGGFTMMTLLAIKYGLDPLKVSMLHLCRLLAINMFLPFLFMLLMSH